MFEQHISSDILFQHDDKLISRNLYLCQPHTVIQLIEVASPPPHRISSVSSAASSSYTSSLYISSSSSSFEEDQGEEEVEVEEESVHSSYCSSDDEIDVRLSPRAASHPDTLSGRMKRILLWREQSPQDSISLKRRLEEIAEGALDIDDNVSHLSKRSRSSDSSSSVSSYRSNVSLELMHSCPACDAFFPTRQSLRQHGRDAQSNEACSVAVEYAFE